MQTFFSKKLQKTFFLLLFVYFILPVTYYFCNNMHFFRILNTFSYKRYTYAFLCRTDIF